MNSVRKLVPILLLAACTSALGQARAYPKITPADLGACKNEIAKLHRMDISFIKNDVATYCTGGKKRYDADNCNHSKKWLHESSTTSDVDWYMKGNGRCDASDYPCFGADLFNRDPNLEIIRLAAEGRNSGETLWDYAYVVDACVAKVWLAKLERTAPRGAPATGNAPAPSAKAALPGVSMAPGQDPFGKVGEGGPNPAPPANSNTPPRDSGNTSPGIGRGVTGTGPSGFSPQQTASCTDEIRRTQLESQSWSGDPDDVAARLGRFQKDLFEGRCAGHPEAQAYINGANKMLAYGGSPAGSGGGTLALANRASTGSESGSVSAGGLPPLRRDPAPLSRNIKSKEHNPLHVASACITIYNEDEMKSRGLKNIMHSLMVNTCNFPISVKWCIEAGNGSPGDCKPGYSNLADLGAKGSRGIDSNFQSVRYAACRHGKNMGFQPVELDPRQPFRFSCS